MERVFEAIPEFTTELIMEYVNKGSIDRKSFNRNQFEIRINPTIIPPYWELRITETQASIFIKLRFVHQYDDDNITGSKAKTFSVSKQCSREYAKNILTAASMNRIGWESEFLRGCIKTLGDEEE